MGHCSNRFFHCFSEVIFVSFGAYVLLILDPCHLSDLESREFKSWVFRRQFCERTCTELIGPACTVQWHLCVLGENFAESFINRHRSDCPAGGRGVWRSAVAFVAHAIV